MKLLTAFQLLWPVLSSFQLECPPLQGKNALFLPSASIAEFLLQPMAFILPGFLEACSMMRVALLLDWVSCLASMPGFFLPHCLCLSLFSWPSSPPSLDLEGSRPHPLSSLPRLFLGDLTQGFKHETQTDNPIWVLDASQTYCTLYETLASNFQLVCTLLSQSSVSANVRPSLSALGSVFLYCLLY